MIANMNEKGRQTKLLAAVAVIAMVVCAMAVIMPSEDVQGAPDDYNPTYSAGDVQLTGDLIVDDVSDLQAYYVSSNSDSGYGNRIVVGSAGATIILEEDIGTGTGGAVDVGFILNGDLTITSATGENHKLVISSSAVTNTRGSTNYNSVVYANADAELTINNADVSLDNKSSGTHIIAIFNNQYEQTNLIVNVVNGAKLTLSQTGTAGTDPGDSGSAWLTYNGAIGTLYINDSDVVFDEIGSVQAIMINAVNGSTLAANMKNATLTAYVTLDSSEMTGTAVGVYSANITNSSVDVTTFGIYTGGTQVYDEYAPGTVSIDSTSEVSATTIVNGLTAGSGVGDNSATITGSGTISGNFTTGTATSDALYKYKLDGVNLGESTITSKVYMDDVNITGNLTVAASSELMIPNGSGTTAATGVTVANSGTVYDLDNTGLTFSSGSATTTLDTETQVSAASGSALVDYINLGYSNIQLSDNITVPAGNDIVIGAGDILDLNGKTLTLSPGDDITINGQILGSTRGTIAISGASNAIVNMAVPTDLTSASAYWFAIQTTNSESKVSSIAITGLYGGDFTVGVGSVDFGGELVLNDTGDVTITGDMVIDENTVINGTVKMAANATLTIPEGLSFTADKIVGTSGNTIYLQGNLVLDGTTGNLTNAQLRVASGAQYSGVNAGTGGTIVYDSQDGEFEFGDTLNSDYTVTSSEYLSGDLTIPAGVTLTIGPNGALNLAGYNIYVLGSIAVEANGTIAGTSGNETLFLLRGGSIENAGVIGSGVPVKVSADTSSLPTGISVNYTGYGFVEMRNVSGVEFALANTSTSSASQYTLTVTGSIEAVGNNSPYGVTVSGVRIIGDVYVGQDVTFDVASTSTLMGSAVMDVDGTLAASGANATGSNLVMANNSIINMYGELTGTITAQTGDYESRSSYSSIPAGSKDTTFTIGDIRNNNTTDANAYITNYTLSVSSYEYQLGSGSNAVAMTAQRLYVSGTMSFECNDDATHTFSGNIVFGGAVNPVVAAETSIVLDENMGITMNNGLAIEVEGQIQFVGTTNPVSDFEGSWYTVTVTTPSRATTGYIVPFETAMGAIGTADRNTVTVNGELEIVSDVTLAAGQTLNIRDAIVTIDEDAELILEARSTLTGTVDDVNGIMTAYSGSSYTAPREYDTLTRGTDFVRYCGIVAAIGIAQPGDTIEVTRPVAGVEDLTIPQGVTVNSSANITLTGDLVIEQEATLAMKDNSVLNMNGAESTVTVNGTLDLQEGSITFGQNTADNAITSTGTTVMMASNLETLVGESSHVVVNGVEYTNDDNMKVLTSAEAAIAAASAQDINKRVTVRGTVSAGDLQVTVDMEIADGARANFSSMALANGCTITINGELTGAITAQTGVAGSEADSTVDLTRATGITVSAGYVTDSQNVRTYEMYVNNITDDTFGGRMTVSAGTATVSTALTVNGANNTVTVANGATLLVKENAVLNVGDAGANRAANSVIVDGTLVADKGTINVGYSGQNGYMAINGTFQVADDTNNVTVSAGSTLTVTGTLDISVTDGEEGSVAVNGVLVVGDKPATLGTVGGGVVNGAVNTNNTGNSYIKTYTGADLTNAQIDLNAAGESDAESSAFYINGELYMTVYSTNVGLAVDTILDAEQFSLTGYETTYQDASYNTVSITNPDNWFTDADMTVKADTDEAVGDHEALYFKANTSTVQVVVSVGEGISLYIDNIRQTSGYPATLTVGTHTVSAQVNPGFSGDITIQFNGQTITNGEFTITADMASAAYEGTITVTASGNITSDSGSGDITVNVPSQDDGMSLTDILLIVLVILILVMAIIVALRLMRS